MKLLKALAFVVGCASPPGLAAELTPDERAALRSRADGLIAERERNPGWDGGTRRTASAQGDVRLDQDRGDVKMPQRGEVDARVKGGQKPREPAGRKLKRAGKEMPGAWVRRR